MQDFSQYGEQEVILRYFRMIPGFETGRFLDIGAWSPVVFSNTRALYELGWSGIMIEPSPGPMQALLNEYGNDERIKLIQACVGLQSGLLDMYVTDDAVSSSSQAEYEKWKSQTAFRGRLTVPAITLEHIFRQYGGFDFVNIDAEGFSADLFLQMLGAKVFPTCVCVEHDSRTTEILTAATSDGYRIELVNSTNVVMVI